MAAAELTKILDYLKVEKGAEATARTNTMTVDGTPITMETVYFPDDREIRFCRFGVVYSLEISDGADVSRVPLKKTEFEKLRADLSLRFQV